MTKDAQKKELTEEQINRYIQAKGLECPYCHHDEFFYCESVEIDPVTILHEVGCEACDKMWLEIYKIVSLEER